MEKLAFAKKWVLSRLNPFAGIFKTKQNRVKKHWCEAKETNKKSAKDYQQQNTFEV